ncbi:MAG: AraC family transcriptional regulator [Muribaculaceae bacterium]
MELLYIPEHTSCHNYVSDVRVGFICPDLAKGTFFTKQSRPENHIIFILSGSASISCNEFRNRIFNAGDIVFLPKMADCEGEVLEDSRLVVLVYSNHVSLCEKMNMQDLHSYCKDIEYDFQSITIREPMTTFLNLLRSYLQAGMSCAHLHEIKQRELFMIFRGYYAKEEVAKLFYPILGKEMDFRNTVMEHYLSAKSAAELAKRCGYSINVFAVKFKAEFDETPYSWMQKQISRHVKGKLLQNEIPLKNIADEYHFSSLEHLIKFCKANLGGTPSQIRQEFGSKDQ